MIVIISLLMVSFCKTYQLLCVRRSWPTGDLAFIYIRDKIQFELSTDANPLERLELQDCSSCNSIEAESLQKPICPLN